MSRRVGWYYVSEERVLEEYDIGPRGITGSVHQWRWRGWGSLRFLYGREKRDVGP